jgi:hypothetical protein
MTEDEWLCCIDPKPMLDFVKATASDRKLRLFACACCRRILHLFTDRNISRKTIEFAERFADGQATRNELHGNAWGTPGQAHPVVQRKAWDAAEGCADYAVGMIANAVLGFDEEKYKAWQSAFDSAWLQQGYHLSEAKDKADASMPAEWVASGKSASSEERKYQSFIFRDIFANPFRLVTVDPSWVTPNVVLLAQANYDERGFDRIAELPDVLQEAGCTNHDIVRHCRQENEHVRGCWVIDLILGNR